MKQGRLDVGFVRGPIEDPSIAFERVRRERLLVALPADHVLAAKKRIQLSALASEPFVCFPRSRAAAFFDSLMAMCHHAGFSPRIVQEAPQLDIVSLVAAGYGVAILPESIREVQRPGIELRPIVGAPSIDLLAAWRANNTSPVLRTFLDIMRRVSTTNL
jgi:DNA-binding transcriptional LysR family regulator